jgi:hypothetical protein
LRGQDNGLTQKKQGIFAGDFWIEFICRRMQCLDVPKFNEKIIMKKNLLLGMFTLVASSLIAADSSPLDTVTNAAAALGNQANYSWHSASESPGGGGFGGGATDGKTEKDGYTWISMTRGDNTTEAAMKGTNAVIKTDNGWQTVAEATADNGGGGFNPMMFIARTLQNYKTPAMQAADLAGQVKELKADTNGISGDLTDDGAKAMLSFRPRGGMGGSQGPDISNAKGSVTFWITDGQLVKYQTHIQGTISFNGNDRDIDRTTTVDIKDVGTTKLDVPDDAKKKLE